MDYKDNFSKIADSYAKYRPHYPAELFEYLSTLTREHQRAWDCATGNGQAALGLTGYFQTVIATEPSEKQLASAIAHPQISYQLAAAEKTGIEAASIDLITVAQALHWFNFAQFYQEVSRVLKPAGVLAVWAYSLAKISPEIDQIISYLHEDIVGSYWQRENRLIDDEYRAIPFPFEQVAPPAISMKACWNLDQLIGYLNTWSAVQKYRDEQSADPIESIYQQLNSAWGSQKDVREISWPLILKIGRAPE